MSEIVSPHPQEKHKSQRMNWLRAAVLGVNDGVVSTASIMLGVLAANASRSTILIAGFAALSAGALSMAMGEYVSVSSQKDSEQADMAIEQRSLESNPDQELAELAHIYVHRGLEPELANKVAKQLHEHDAKAAHLRDELGIDVEALANPAQAALASAVSFSIGGTVPIIGALVSSKSMGAWVIVIFSLLALAISGAIGAFIGGGHRVRAAARVFFGGGAAMAITAFIGHLVGHSL
ncbi:MAG TPA: VIT family protein [Candidatus Saccharimonadales bacterium]|nr:VIT family protein [Candidatus Saccharimonadales bacterium]